ncbi:MAG: hypothetical protein E3J72_08460 [Planctomycetota bacterium]|nr:MAG: hypothetical protein E3J72_08460 [Planctomycetota bacterium]
MRKPFTLLAASLLAVLFCAAGLACGKSKSKSKFIFLPPPGDPTNAVFKANRVVEVSIELAPGDWDLLRHEGRGLVTTFSGCSSEFTYTYFAATATIDGERIENVAVRKKGFLGSLSVLRPSIKINFGKIIDGQTWSGMKRMTLNNDLQDPSHTHQVMSYALFRKAGTVAPRCNFAHVTVNGVDLGVYSHVEAIKKPFLARHFNDNTGNLYEGQLADFTPELVSRFQRKTNKTIPDRSDLDRITQALETDNAGLLAALEQVIDVDSFLTFWAMEVISGHWDGYDSNRNNFYFYIDPETGLAHFIPWGTDGAFNEGNPFTPNTPVSVFAMSKIAYRLYNCPETRPLYIDRLRSLLDDVWNEGALLAEVDRIEQLVPCDAGAVQRQRDFIMKRRNDILAEISGNGPDWPFPFSSQAPVYREPLPISGTFSATWGSPDNFVTNGNVSMTMTLGGVPQVFSAVYNSAGADNGKASIIFICFRATGNDLAIFLNIPPSFVGPGDVEFHGFETVGMILEIDPIGDPRLLGFIGDGTITFDAAGTTPGDEVSGSFNALMPQ